MARRSSRLLWGTVAVGHESENASEREIDFMPWRRHRHRREKGRVGVSLFLSLTRETPCTWQGHATATRTSLFRQETVVIFFGDRLFSLPVSILELLNELEPHRLTKRYLANGIFGENMGALSSAHPVACLLRESRDHALLPVYRSSLVCFFSFFF